MNALRTVFGEPRSLKRVLILNILVALSMSILLAGAVMIYEFYEHLEESLEEALSAEAAEIIRQVDPEATEFGLDGDALRFRGVEGAFRYTVFDAAGQAVAGSETSPAIWAQLQNAELGLPEPIALPGDRVAIGLRSRIKGQDVIALVSTYPSGKDQTQAQKLLHEIEEQIVWVALGFIMILTAAALATRRALSPLGRLLGQADLISPTDADQRLTTQDVPAEITPLIDAINGAFGRLEAGYRAQSDFASNVAHEVRTPLAILRSSVDRIDRPELKASLVQDVERLDQIFQQLIDLARADTAPKSNFETVDLNWIAVSVASDMAQAALRVGHALSISGAQSVEVLGNQGLLGVALRNVITNALQYAPAGSDVDIEILQDPAGWQVSDRGPGVPDDMKPALFDRFNRGNQSTGKPEGSGIGLAIVKSVASSHDATVTIHDRTGGGSIFAFVFNGSSSDYR
ncbi:sensor histidine kinase [Roseinatronobacter sp.]|uniref:sensor histidine kinase n=1 Tax=Roseinatronobacter sp. TaxID=1945755 RepID=UPI0025D940B8|nr:HAMP domain-containing sensor histidine kinase [Roseibaca sp.]